jgi:hypothetical protein
MKEIGRTNDGDHIMEMTETEHHAFVLLANVFGYNANAGILGQYPVFRETAMIHMEDPITAVFNYVRDVSNLMELHEHFGQVIADLTKGAKKGDETKDIT